MTTTSTRGELQGSSVDVVILGGGLAGLSLAIQLKLARPATRVAVLEKRAWPVPQVAHKVGESLLQIGASYFESVCGMGSHLKEEQLSKMGLRFFLPGGEGNLNERVEIGLASWVDNAPTYQLDRGRFENALATEARRLGVCLYERSAVTDVQRSGDISSISYRKDSERHQLHSRWVVDASGRASVLKHKLGLGVEVTHHCNAAWFRIGRRIKIDDWSEDQAWQERVPAGTRWQSTNHLMGPGYWFWVIPLASDATSFGLVADPDLVPFEAIRRFKPLLDWLRTHEPAAAEIVTRHSDALRDFRTLKHYAHGCRQVISPDGWCITGEAGVFLDPLYSPGSDAIAIANTMITRVLTGSLDGDDMTATIELFNNLYLLMTSRLLTIWDHQYPLFGSPEVAAAKITWDFLGYFGSLALLGVTGRLADTDFVASVLPHVYRISELNHSMQRYLREWNERAGAGEPVGYACLSAQTYLQLEREIAESRVREDDWVRDKIVDNAARIEAAAVEIMARSAGALGIDVDPDRLDPNSFALAGGSHSSAAAGAVTGMDASPRARRTAASGLTWATRDDPSATVAEAYSLWLPNALTPRQPAASSSSESLAATAAS